MSRDVPRGYAPRTRIVCTLGPASGDEAVLRIRRVTGAGIETRVEIGGLLKERKAVSFPGAAPRFPLLSARDARDVDYAVEQALDFLALSFVRSAADVRAVREHLGGRLPGCRLIAKIESQEGIDNIAAILEEADGVMLSAETAVGRYPVLAVAMMNQIVRYTECNAPRALKEETE